MEGSGLDHNPFALAPTPENTGPPPEHFGIISSLVRGAGGVISGTGRALEDVGLPTKGVEEYGQRLVDENPAQVTTLGEAAKDPLQFAKETAGSVAPQIGANLVAGGIGAVVGGGLATLAGPEATPLGAVAGRAAGVALGSKVGQWAQDFIQQYGNMRQGQDQGDIDDKFRAAAAAASAATIDLLSPAESLTRKVFTGGVAPVAKKSLGTFAREAGIGAVTGAGTMAADTALQRAGSGQPVTGEDATSDHGIAALTGGVGGGAAHSVAHAIAPHGEPSGQQPVRDAPTRRRPGINWRCLRRARCSAPEGEADTGQRALPGRGPGEQRALPAPTPRLMRSETALHDALLEAILQDGIWTVETHHKANQISPKGATGALQLMPDTARAMAQRLNLPFSMDRLLHDDQYNATLGKEYLRDLDNQFGHDKFLAVTAYNAGPLSGATCGVDHELGYDPDNPHAWLDKIEARWQPGLSRLPAQGHGRDGLR